MDPLDIKRERTRLCIAMRRDHAAFANPSAAAERTAASQNVSPGNAMIVPRALFRGGFAMASIAQAIDD
jgi:sirohydrochlorin ferrochelatase